MVVCESNSDDQTYQDRPVILIEVLSESTRRIDEGEKRDHYLTAASLQTYVLLEVDAPAAQVYQRCSNGTFAESIFADPHDVIPLPNINGQLRFTDLYRSSE